MFAFRHALTREAIAGRLLGRERRRLHEKALAAIQESGGDDWAAVAWHAQGAGRYDELVEAARSGAWSYLQQGSTAEALRLAETGLSEADRDLDLLAAASKAAWMIGLQSLAIEHGERWHRGGRGRRRPRAGGRGPDPPGPALLGGAGLPAPVADGVGRPGRGRAARRVRDPGPRLQPGRRGPHAERPARRGRRVGRQGAGHGRRRRQPGRAGLGPGQQGHRPGRHARTATTRASPCSSRRSPRPRPATSATCSTGPSTTCSSTSSAAGRRSAATRSCGGCGRPASGPAAGRRRPAGPCSRSAIAVVEGDLADGP